MDLLARLGMTVPLVQAPMAGVSTPSLAAAVSNAGGLGSIGLGASNTATAQEMIHAVRAQTERPFNVNLFVHATPVLSPERDAAWLNWLAPLFAEFGEAPPTQLNTLYTSFNDDPDMLDMLLHVRPPVISFHFGLPLVQTVLALKATGAVLLASVTSLDEARAAEAAGLDAVVAQGIEAGGHRGIFNPEGEDDALGIMPLTRLLVKQGRLPVIAAGGIMDGAGIAAALALGACAAQMGTAFILCPESSADTGYRQTLSGPAAFHTRLTHLVSGRPARCLGNRFTALEAIADKPVTPAYPVTYDAGKALHKAAMKQGDYGYGAYWAGQGAPLARAMPAQELVMKLVEELKQVRAEK